MKEVVEWKSFRKYTEFDQKQKNKAIRDNFKTIALLMAEQNTENRVIFDIEKKSAERLGLKAFPFYIDTFGNVFIRNSLEIDGRRKNVKMVKQELNQLKEWLTQYYNPEAKLLLCVEEKKVTPVILDPLIDTKQLDEEEFKIRIEMLLNVLEGSELHKAKKIKMKALFDRKQVNEGVDELMESYKETLKIRGEEAYREMKNSIDIEIKAIKNELYEYGYVERVEKWLNENETYGFSETMDLLYIEN